MESFHHVCSKYNIWAWGMLKSPPATQNSDLLNWNPWNDLEILPNWQIAQRTVRNISTFAQLNCCNCSRSVNSCPEDSSYAWHGMSEIENHCAPKHQYCCLDKRNLIKCTWIWCKILAWYKPDLKRVTESLWMKAKDLTQNAKYF